MRLRGLWIGLLLLSIGLPVGADTAYTDAELRPFVMGAVSYLKQHPASYDHQLLREALRLHGYRMEMRYFPGRRLLSELNSGQVDGDLLRVVNLSQQLSNVIRIELPISSNCAWVYGLAETSSSPMHKQRPRLGLYRGTPGGHQLAAKVMPEAEVILFNHLTQAAKMLENQRVDLVGLVTWQIPTFTQLMKRPIAAFGQFVIPPNYVHFHRRHSELAEALVNTLRQLQSDNPSPQCQIEDRFRPNIAEPAQ